MTVSRLTCCRRVHSRFANPRHFRHWVRMRGPRQVEDFGNMEMKIQEQLKHKLDHWIHAFRSRQIYNNRFWVSANVTVERLLVCGSILQSSKCWSKIDPKWVPKPIPKRSKNDHGGNHENIINMQGAKTSKIIFPCGHRVHLHKPISFKTIFEQIQKERIQIILKMIPK